uniref:Uncharacterized protein n=1 Tax=Rhizophora mucronata TaxID=61149 RepID=A0A2P2N0D2_RHIMU
MTSGKLVKVGSSKFSLSRPQVFGRKNCTMDFLKKTAIEPKIRKQMEKENLDVTQISAQGLNHLHQYEGNRTKEKASCE